MNATMNRAQLLSALQHLVTQDRSNTAELIRTMGRVDAEKLFAKEGYASMFAFCVERYRMSEAQANKRIRVARLARRFPAVIPMIHRGELHLGGLLAVSSHLTEENHESVLARAKGLTIRQTEKLASELRPLPDVPTRIRALPRPRQQVKSLENAPLVSLPPPAAQPQLCGPFPPRKRGKDPQPLSPKRFKITMTISQETNETLEQLQELMSHELPNGDPAVIVEKALAHLLKQKLKEKAAQVVVANTCEWSSTPIPSSMRSKTARRLPN